MPIRKYLEPALRVVMDENRKLMRLAAPYTDTADGKNGFPQTWEVVGKLTKEHLYFAGYARADKCLNPRGLHDC